MDININWQEDLNAALTASVPLKALIGEKIFPTQAPDNEKGPYIVWQEVSSISETAHDGPQDLDFPLVQFVAWAPSVLVAAKVRKQLRIALEGQPPLAGTAEVTASFNNSLMMYDSGTKLHGAMLELRLHVKT